MGSQVSGRWASQVESAGPNELLILLIKALVIFCHTDGLLKKRSGYYNCKGQGENLSPIYREAHP